MKVCITFYGMFLIELSAKNRSTRVLAVNATTMNQPYHHPILCANRGTLAVTPALPSVPSLDGLLDRASMVLQTDAEGWHLSGITMTVGRGQVPKHTRGFSAKEARHPKSVDAAWSSMKWLPDLKQIQPGATLKEEYRHISKNVLAIVELRGGQLKALKPSDARTAGLLWWFSPSCQQAITDMFCWEGEIGDGMQLKAASGAVSVATPTPSKETTQLFFSHEAPRFERQLEFERLVRERGEQAVAGDPRLDHFTAFYRAMNNCRYDLEAPRGIWRFDKTAESTFQTPADCFSGMI
jgi:hypothetical protein